MIRLAAATSELFSAWIGQRRAVLAGAVRAGVAAATDGLKLELRQAIAGAGLGTRLGNAIGSKVFPRGPSLGAAGTIYPRGKRAELLVTTFSQGATIRGRSGNLLALPTHDTPGMPDGKGGSRYMTPVEVEALFNRDLRFVPTRTGKSVGVLVMDDVVRGRARRKGRRSRPATARRIAQGRARVSLVMFVLVRQVVLRSRYDAEALARRWGERVPELIERALPGDS